ncbi:MAG TPA: hypothetical protein VFM68_03760 [Candidatus Saccharimonadales bacterium]|nr:hypothetical protein [Candidatus Saccharimonadales bacterium]
MLTALVAGRVLDVDNQGRFRNIGRNFKQRKVALMILFIVAGVAQVLGVVMGTAAYVTWQFAPAFVMVELVVSLLQIAVIAAVSYSVLTPNRMVGLNDWLQHKFDKQQSHNQSETPPTNLPQTPPRPPQKPPHQPSK